MKKTLIAALAALVLMIAPPAFAHGWHHSHHHDSLGASVGRVVVLGAGFQLGKEIVRCAFGECGNTRTVVVVRQPIQQCVRGYTRDEYGYLVPVRVCTTVYQ